MFEVIAGSIVNLDSDKWEVQFQWFSAFGGKFTNTLKEFIASHSGKENSFGYY